MHSLYLLLRTTLLSSLAHVGFFFVFCAQADPLISIITSVYDGDTFIEGFMADIVQQTIFDQCELIMIDANSPGNEQAVIRAYQRRYHNIIYCRLEHDPGIYAVWNKAIAMARGQFITNANLDDRLKADCYAVHVQALLAHPEVDLVYSDFYVTYYQNETFDHNRHSHVRNLPEFSPHHMWQPLPNNHPLWRKSLHDKYGFFDETFFHAGDWEMWLRAVAGGAVFMKVPGIYGLYYYNPHGLSTDARKKKRIVAEEERVHARYSNVWQ